MVKHISNINLEKTIMAEGKKVKAIITSCKCCDDPEDREHTIYEIDFEYNITDIHISKNFSFSINTAHLEYANLGELLDVPKLNCSLNDFAKMLSPGEYLEIVSLEYPPYEYVLIFNYRLSEVMKYKQMWM
jgi:hypothetical protein